MSSSSTRTQLVFSHTRSKTPRHWNCQLLPCLQPGTLVLTFFSYKKATLNQSLPFQLYLNAFTALSFKPPIFLINSAKYLQSTHSKCYSSTQKPPMAPLCLENKTCHWTSPASFSIAVKPNIRYLPNHPRFFWILFFLLAIPRYLSTYPSPSGLEKPDLNSLSPRSLCSDKTIKNYFSDI